MYQLRLLQSFILFLNLFVSVSVYAADEMTSHETQEVCLDLEDENEDESFEHDDKKSTIPSKNESSYFSYLDSSQQYISSSLNSLATNLDAFFANEKTDYTLSGSYLRLGYSSIWNEEGELSNSSNINFKLRLPNTENKLKFVFETDTAETDSNSTQTIKSNTTDNVDEKEYLAGLQATLKDVEHWRFRTSGGVRLRDSFDAYIRLNMDWRDKYGNWHLHWNEKPYWSNFTGWGLDSLFEIDRNLSNKILFRSSSLARWTATLDYFNLSQVFAIFQVLSDKSAVSYQAGVYGVDEPEILTTNYLLSMSYRRNIYKDYLFFEFTPQINYIKTENFSPEHSITFKLDMIFKG